MKKFYLLCMTLLASLVATAQDYYLIGGFNGWTLKDESCKFTQTSQSGVYSVKVSELTSGFKINSGSWDSGVNFGSNGSDLEPGTPYKYVQTSNRDLEIKMTVTVTDATVYLDVTDGIIYVDGASVSSKIIGWDVFGDFSGDGTWTGIDLTNTVGTQWTSAPVTLSGTGGFGVRQLANGNQDVWYASSTDGVTLSESNPKVSLASGPVKDFTYNLNGTYVFVLDTSDMTLSVKSPDEVYSLTMYLIGDAPKVAWTFNEGKKMDEVSPGVYTLTGVQLGSESSEYDFAFAGTLSASARSMDGMTYLYYPPSRSDVKVYLDEGGSATEDVARLTEDYSGSWGVYGGIYDIKLDIPNMLLTITCTKLLQTDHATEPDVPETLYVLGSINNQEWSPSQGTKMDYIGNGQFTLVADNVHTFSLSTALLSSGDDTWATLNNMNVRYGIAGSTDKSLSAGESTPFVQATSPMAVQATPTGRYEILVDWPGKTITLRQPVTTGIDAVDGDYADVKPVYYNMLGVEVENPQPGIYIVKRGDRVTKELLR